MFHAGLESHKHCIILWCIQFAWQYLVMAKSMLEDRGSEIKIILWFLLWHLVLFFVSLCVVFYTYICIRVTQLHMVIWLTAALKVKQFLNGIIQKTSQLPGNPFCTREFSCNILCKYKTVDQNLMWYHYQQKWVLIWTNFKTICN
jgi:hypothetical protein